MNTPLKPPEPAREYRARSSAPFFAGLAILSGFYVVLIVGMLLAEVLFLFPPNQQVMIVPKDNPAGITHLEDLRDPSVKIGLGNEKSKFGQNTRKLLNVSWLHDDIQNVNREEKIFYTEDPKQLVDKVTTGVLDVAIISQHDLTQSPLALGVPEGNPKKIARLQDLTREDLKIGIETDRETNLGKRTHELLLAAGLDQRIAYQVKNQSPFFLKSQRQTLRKTTLALLGSPAPLGKVSLLPELSASLKNKIKPQDVIDAVAEESLDVALVFAKNPSLNFDRVQKILLQPETVSIDASRYPGHLSGWMYPFWWLNIKFRSFLAPLEQKQIRYALNLSLISCCMTTILCLWVAVPFGYLMSRFQFPGKTIIDAILDIPIVLPPLVIGLALLILFGTSFGEFIEEHFMVFRFAIPSVILAQFSVACAFAVRTMRVTFDQISTRQEQVALTLGCSRGQAFWKVVLPESKRGIITAATLAWARSLGEFGPILVFSGATRMRTEVLPTTVYLELNVGNIETAVAVSLLMVLAAAIVLVIVRLYGMEKTPVQVK